MDQPVGLTGGTRQLFQHYLYEYKKGVRQLFMMTMTAVEAVSVVDRLTGAEVDHYVHKVTENKVNVFFGRAALVETIRNVVNKPLHQLSPEEDFILGTLLGYDKEQQCQRFLSRARR